AFYIGWFFIFQVALLYDFHYRDRTNPKVEIRALKRRFKHLLDWDFFSQWMHYLILPSLIYWGSLSLIYINFGFPKVQQIIVVFSSAAFYIYYLYLKEIFLRQRQVIDRDIFVALS